MYSYDDRADWCPDYLILQKPESVMRFVFRGVPRDVLRHIQHLRIQFDFDYDAYDRQHEIWLIAIGIVLRILPELKDLVLLWNGVPSRVFRNVPFQLEALTSTMEIDDESLAFLHSQSQLRLVELPRWQIVDFSGRSHSHHHQFPTSSGAKSVRYSSSRSIPRSRSSSLFSDETFLPNLSELSAPPQAVQALVPGRPVRSVDIRLNRGDRVENWDAVVRALSQSTCPMDDLAIATLNEFSFEMLESLRWLPSLMSLYVRVYAPSRMDSEILSWSRWSPHLSHLPYLENLRVEFDARHLPHIHPQWPIPTFKCISAWHRTCPDLAVVYVGLYTGDALILWERTPETPMRTGGNGLNITTGVGHGETWSAIQSPVEELQGV